MSWVYPVIFFFKFFSFINLFVNEKGHLDLEENGERNLRRCLSDPSWNLKDILLDVTKFSIADLIASILRLDFWDPKNTDSMFVHFSNFEFFIFLFIFQFI